MGFGAYPFPYLHVVKIFRNYEQCLLVELYCEIMCVIQRQIGRKEIRAMNQVGIHNSSMKSSSNPSGMSIPVTPGPRAIVANDE